MEYPFGHYYSTAMDQSITVKTVTGHPLLYGVHDGASCANWLATIASQSSRVYVWPAWADPKNERNTAMTTTSERIAPSPTEENDTVTTHEQEKALRRASDAEWDAFSAALDREHRANLRRGRRERGLRPDSLALAEHVRALRNHVGKAREILGSDGHYVTTAARIMADDELFDAISRCNMLLIALNTGIQCPS